MSTSTTVWFHPGVKWSINKIIRRQQRFTFYSDNRFRSPPRMVRSVFIHKILAEYKRRGLRFSHLCARYIPGGAVFCIEQRQRHLISRHCSHHVCQQLAAWHGHSIRLQYRIQWRDKHVQEMRGDPWRREVDSVLSGGQCEGINTFSICVEDLMSGDGHIDDTHPIMADVHNVCFS